VTLQPDAGRGEGSAEAHLGPFAASTPGLGYLEHLSEFDSDAEMWRQIVPNQSGRGLALGRWGLHNYEEYGDYPEPVSLESNPLWVPMLVEWASVTCLDGVQIKPDSWYLEEFHGPDEMEGEDALPVVGILSSHSTWPSLSGPWSMHAPDGMWYELMDGSLSQDGRVQMVMPVNHVLPIEDEQVLIAISETIKEIERMWPMDNCMPSSLSEDDFYFVGEVPLRDQALQLGHRAECFTAVNPATSWASDYLSCIWDPANGCCRPCGGHAHITAVLDSFAEVQPYERLCFDPLLIPYWDRLKDRNARFYASLLSKQEQTRGRSWYYSFSRQWSPWGHSSQVPVQHLV